MTTVRGLIIFPAAEIGVQFTAPGDRHAAAQEEANRTLLDGGYPGDPAGCTLSGAVKNHNALTDSFDDLRHTPVDDPDGLVGSSVRARPSAHRLPYRSSTCGARPQSSTSSETACLGRVSRRSSLPAAGWSHS